MEGLLGQYLMAQWLRRASKVHKRFCRDPDGMELNPSWEEHRVRSPSV